MEEDTKLDLLRKALNVFREGWKKRIILKWKTICTKYISQVGDGSKHYRRHLVSYLFLYHCRFPIHILLYSAIQQAAASPY